MREHTMTQAVVLLVVAGLWGVGTAPAQTISGEQALMSRTGPGPGIETTVVGPMTDRGTIEPSRALLGRPSGPNASVEGLNTKPGEAQIAVSPERALLARVRE